MTHPANLNRIGWATRALDTFTLETYGGRPFATLLAQAKRDPAEEAPNTDAFTAVQDLIGDLFHVAHAQGWDVEDLTRRARDNFDYEAAPGYQGD